MCPVSSTKKPLLDERSNWTRQNSYSPSREKREGRREAGRQAGREGRKGREGGGEKCLIG
jgi:hypothetical protein